MNTPTPTPLGNEGLDLLFNDARTYNDWLDKPVTEAELRRVWDLTRMGPTSANCSPGRIIFVTTPASREKLKPCLAEGNVAKTMSARALGLDCGPMSGFDSAAVDAAFFAGTNIKSNFLCNIGHGDASTIFARSPRFEFDDACQVI